MIILGIETSCDDTGIAIIEATPTLVGVKFDILANVVSSQIKTHAKYGGVVPNLAAREHLKNIEPCLKQAFQKTNLKLSNIDLIAVTIGPGLIPSLLIGVHYAKALAYRLGKPIVSVNHIEAHILAALFGANPKSEARNPKQIQNTKYKIQNTFPAIALVVSGGHTQLVLVNPVRNRKFSNGASYKILGETRDDAAGECFDKVAKLLGLGYPGGPPIAEQAQRWKSEARNPKFEIKLPRPMINHKNFDFSFSGLKTAVLYLLEDIKQKYPLFSDRTKDGINIIPELCYEVQQAIIDVLIEKTLRAAKEYEAKTIILSGGVAANDELRKQLKFKIQNSKFKIQFLTPVKNLCMDNGAMIAMAGYYNKDKATKNYKKIIANANLRIGA